MGEQQTVDGDPRKADKSELGQLLCVEEVASRISCSKSYVYREIAASRLSVFRLRNRIRISEEDLAAYLERHREAADFSRLAKKQHF